MKVDDHRLGRDLEIYGFMAGVSSDAQALGDFVGEVMLPVKSMVPRAYETVAPLLEQLGYRLIDTAYHEGWRAIFAEPTTE